jgi:hypothetical protein
MRNIRIIRTGLDLKLIKDQLREFSSDWGLQRKLEGAAQQDPNQFYTQSDALQLVMGGIEHEGQYVGDTDISIPTPAFKRHTAILELLRDELKVPTVRRCAFLTLPVGGETKRHCDFGSYYLNKDRYHVSIQGTYVYTVWDADGTAESITIEPGTFFWFNNKLDHGAVNTGNQTRITFVFDVPHDSRNP